HVPRNSEGRPVRFAHRPLLASKHHLKAQDWAPCFCPDEASRSLPAGPDFLPRGGEPSHGASRFASQLSRSHLSLKTSRYPKAKAIESLGRRTDFQSFPMFTLISRAIRSEAASITFMQYY